MAIIGTIWTMDIEQGSSVVELLTQVARVPGSISDQSIYFHSIHMLIPPFLQHQFCLRDHYIVCMNDCVYLYMWTCLIVRQVKRGQIWTTQQDLNRKPCQFIPPQVHYMQVLHRLKQKFTYYNVHHKYLNHKEGVFTGIKFGIFIAWRYYVNHFGKLWFDGHRHSICCLYVLILKGKI